jgi:penicillin-binding protein-related factor A (putative recombinase)
LVIIKACRRRKTLPLNVLFVLQNDAHGHEHIQSIVYTSPYVFFILAYKTNNRHFFLTAKIIISSVKTRILQWGLPLLDQLPIQWVSLSLWVSHCC